MGRTSPSKQTIGIFAILAVCVQEVIQEKVKRVIRSKRDK
jgi:hypothetical protein